MSNLLNHLSLTLWSFLSTNGKQVEALLSPPNRLKACVRQTRDSMVCRPGCSVALREARTRVFPSLPISLHSECEFAMIFWVIGMLWVSWKLSFPHPSLWSCRKRPSCSTTLMKLHGPIIKTWPMSYLSHMNNLLNVIRHQFTLLHHDALRRTAAAKATQDSRPKWELC